MYGDELPKTAESRALTAPPVCAWLGLACLVGVVLAGGCGLSQARVRIDRWLTDRWLADFETAERMVTKTGRDLIIGYTHERDRRRSPLIQALTSESLAGALSGKVRCTLSKSYEPDRRYVAQFGVDRAPALILVHRDGTYHAHSGSMTVEDIRTFLASARPPGLRPVFNAHIQRQARYRWLDSFEAARARAAGTGRPMLVVYYRRFSQDWRRLERLLSRHEVYKRLAGLVPCRLRLSGVSKDLAITRFGTVHLPAIVIVREDGKHSVLERPMSYEAVVRFAEGALSPAVQAGMTSTVIGPSSAGNASKP